MVIGPGVCKLLKQSLGCLEVEGEKLGFVKDDWLTFIVKITLLEKLGSLIK